MDQPAIEIQSVTKSFGRKTVLHGLNLRVEAGKTFAFLGRNGAGKTTTIHMMLGMLAADAGRIHVLGLDPTLAALEIRRRVGCLAEDQQMWGWMKVKELLGFMAPFYPTWDMGLACDYVKRFDLALDVRIKNLSKGQTVQLGLLVALAHRPELVVLDDPTLGLDPIMRKMFLRDVVEHLQGRGVTVFFSSHLLYEVEPVADEVAILDHGKIIKQAATEDLRAQVKRMLLDAQAYRDMKVVLPVLDETTSGRQVAIVVENAPEAEAELRRQGLSPQVIDLNLDEIFEAYVMGNRHESSNPAQPLVERVA